MKKQSAIHTAQKYISLIKKNGIVVKRAYLFGSCAKNTANYQSDIDIAIVSPSFTKNRQTHRVQLMIMRHEVSDMIEPHPISLDEYAFAENPFIKEIKKGVLLR